MYEANLGAMDQRAMDLVGRYLEATSDQSCGPLPPFGVFIVWKCKTLQNWKYLISTTLPNNSYFELTYNGDKEEWYLDHYVKVRNEVHVDD